MEWAGHLKRVLQEAFGSGGLVVFVGVGNTLREDDGIGVRIAESLKNAVERENVKVIIVEDRLDILDRLLGDLNPSLLIFFDAADFGGKPGEIRILSPEEASGTAVSTHMIPLNAILEVSGIKAPSYVVGIQAVKLGFGEEMSDPVKDAGKIIIEFLKEVCGQ